ncbi:hypothetical protein GGS24DRAFT_498563 [Hypoxylon argillaceum]|nr:hypothetical protein GGS24DRAFT_498563 [Hypoxylon argillaceum]
MEVSYPGALVGWSLIRSGGPAAVDSIWACKNVCEDLPWIVIFVVAVTAAFLRRHGEMGVKRRTRLLSLKAFLEMSASEEVLTSFLIGKRAASLGCRVSRRGSIN